jgi:hypothetical protein
MVVTFFFLSKQITGEGQRGRGKKQQRSKQKLKNNQGSAWKNLKPIGDGHRDWPDSLGSWRKAQERDRAALDGGLKGPVNYLKYLL